MDQVKLPEIVWAFNGFATEIAKVDGVAIGHVALRGRPDYDDAYEVVLYNSEGEKNSWSGKPEPAATAYVGPEQDKARFLKMVEEALERGTPSDILTIMKGNRQHNRSFPERVRFNWGFHDGTGEAERAAVRGMEDHQDRAYANGYVRGVLAWKNLGYRPETSDEAWSTYQNHPIAGPATVKLPEASVDLDAAAQRIGDAMYALIPDGEVDVVVADDRQSVEIVRLIAGIEGCGDGTRAMKAAIELADTLGVRLTLTPDGSYYDDEKAAEARLQGFYARFGFVADARGAMARDCQRKLPETKPLRINVRQVSKELDDPEDQSVTGIYAVTFRVDDRQLSDAKRASIALDIFHAHQGIGCLDDFEIEVIDGGNNVIDQDPDHMDYSGSDDGDVEKISAEPVAGNELKLPTNDEGKLPLISVRKTVIQFTVLHDDGKDLSSLSLRDIAYECDEGGYVGGGLKVISNKALTRQQLDTEAANIGSDATFFDIDPDDAMPEQSK